MKRCHTCKNMNVRESNGIAISKNCVTCRNVKISEKKAKHRTTKGFLKSQYKKLHSKAWSLFSKVIRTEYTRSGYIRCYTCHIAMTFSEAQAGHFIHGKLDFDRRNIHPQCQQCNLYKSGNLAEYGIRLAGELGADGMEKLRYDSYTIKYTIEDLEKIIQECTEKLKIPL